MGTRKRRGAGEGWSEGERLSSWVWEVLGEEGGSEQQDSVMSGWQQGALRAVELVGQCGRPSG